jgi:hypothetical protein
MYKKNLISPQVYIYNSDKSYYNKLKPNNTTLGSGGAGGAGGGGSIKSNTRPNGSNGNGNSVLFCSAIKYSQGYDPFVNYTYDNVIIAGVVNHSPYVECDYVI